MNDVDKVSKEVKNVVESVKDTLQSRIVSAARSDTLQLSQQQVEKLVQLVQVTFDESYQKAIVHFQRSVKKYFDPNNK